MMREGAHPGFSGWGGVCASPRRAHGVHYRACKKRRRRRMGLLFVVCDSFLFSLF